MGRLSLWVLAAPTASQMAMLSSRNHLPAAALHRSWWPPQKQSSRVSDLIHWLLFPSDGWARNMGFPSLPVMRRTHTHRHARSSPGSAGVHRLCPGVHGQPGSQLLTPDVARISTWGMADSSGPWWRICVSNYQEAVKNQSQAKDTRGPPGFRPCSSRGWAQCPAQGCRGHCPSTARSCQACPCLPHAWGPRPHIHGRRSIAAPTFSSNGLCQAGRPREQSEQEASAAKAAPGCSGALQGEGAVHAMPALLLRNFPNVKKSRRLHCWQGTHTLVLGSLQI